MSDTDEKVRTELPNSLLAAWANHRSLRQFEVLTDLRKMFYWQPNVHLRRTVFTDARYGDALASLRESRSNISHYAQSLFYLVILLCHFPQLLHGARDRSDEWATVAR